MKIICVGRNYASHAKELGNEVPDEPVIFMKPKSSLVENRKAVRYPEFTNELHYECELVVKVSKNGCFIDPFDAPNYYKEVTLGIDFTARDIQEKLKKKGLPWEKAKAFDQSAIVGSWKAVSALPNHNNVAFKFMKNGVLVQQAQTREMIFSIDAIIADVSRYFTLNIGDLIFTGTPPGVGECVTGDLLEGYMEGEKVLETKIW